MLLQPRLQANVFAQPGHGAVRGIPEQVHSYNKEKHVDYTRNKDPFPQFVLADELMGVDIRLDGYDDLF